MKSLKISGRRRTRRSRVFKIVYYRYRSQKIYSQQQNILDSSSCRSGGTILLYNNSIKRICTDRDLTMSYFATSSLLSTKNGDFSGRKYCQYWGSTVGCTEETCSIKRTNI